MSKLVIAEKPMLARDIARAITGKEVSESARLPISGNGYTVCACAGHLLELVKPDAIDPKWGMPWSLDVLPIEVHDWPKEPAVDKKTGESKKPLIDQIAGLLKTCDSVIAAGDPDDEGQLIVDELLDYLGYAGKVERVYVNDNIEKNIVKAFDKLVPNDSCRGAGNAAYARQMADMCFGVNETRLATKRLDGLFTVGRVQTPTLGLVVKRMPENSPSSICRERSCLPVRSICSSGIRWKPLRKSSTDATCTLKRPYRKSRRTRRFPTT